VFGVKKSCARLLRDRFASLKIKVGFLSAQHIPSLSASPSPSASLCLLAAFCWRGCEGAFLATAEDGSEVVHKRTHSNLAHSRGWGREAFWICQLICTARFLSKSRSCTSPWWLRCNRRSRVALEKQTCEATGSFLPRHAASQFTNWFAIRCYVLNSTPILFHVLCAPSFASVLISIFCLCTFISLPPHIINSFNHDSVILIAGKL